WPRFSTALRIWSPAGRCRTSISPKREWDPKLLPGARVGATKQRETRTTVVGCDLSGCPAVSSKSDGAFLSDRRFAAESHRRESARRKASRRRRCASALCYG